MTKTFTFLDTSILVSRPEEMDDRISTLSFMDQQLCITETVKSELTEKIQRGFKLILKKRFKLVRFEDLRSKNPAICPVYYNFISAMHNPAMLHMDDFLPEMILGQITRKDMSKKILDYYSSKIATERDSTNISSDRLKFKLADSELKNWRKKKSAFTRGEDNYFNDLRTLSLIFAYGLSKKVNIRIVTADSDFPINMIKWAAAIVHELTFKSMIIKALSKEQYQKILNNELVTVYLDRNEFYESQMQGLNHIYGINTGGMRIDIDCWDNNTKQYDNFYLCIDDYFQELILNCHGQHICHFHKNDSFENHIGWKWWPPGPLDNQNLIKTEVRNKGFSKREYNVDEKTHKKMCRYIKEDSKNNLAFFSQFIQSKF